VERPSLSGPLAKIAIAIAITAAAHAPHALAQGPAAEWPSRPIRIVVPQAPGGPPDRIGRFVAQGLAQALGVPVTVENRPGATGVIGSEVAMRAAPDGYTLLIASFTTHVLVPATAEPPPYDALRDFAPVINLHRSIKAIFVPAALPPRTLAEFVAYVKARPGALNYATGGAGSSNHVDMELFRASAGMDITHIPYNGPAAGIAAVASGEAQAMIVSVTTALGAVQAGKVRALALFAAKRTPLLPGVPTAAEAGFGDVDLSAWIGLLAPAGTPPEIVARLNGEVERILREPEAVVWADRQALEVVGGSAASFAATIESDRQRWTGVVKKLRIGLN